MLSKYADIYTRISDHIRILALTDKKLDNHSLSAITHRHRDSGHPVTPNNFCLNPLFN